MKGKTTKRDERRRKLASALIIGAMGGVAAQPALAQHIQQISDERIEFEIAAQPLSSALSEFARQARVNALYFSDDLRGLSAPQLRGSYTRQQALDLLLARSGYNGRISGGNLVLAQEQSSRPQRESAASGAETTQASNVANGGTEDEEEIVVTGTRIRGAVPAGANLLTLDRGNIEESGRTTVQDLLQTLPQVFPGSQGELTQLNSTAPGNNIALGSTVDLRGLGSDATLTLLNGRRLAPAGLGNFVDKLDRSYAWRRRALGAEFHRTLHRPLRPPAQRRCAHAQSAGALHHRIFNVAGNPGLILFAGSAMKRAALLCLVSCFAVVPPAHAQNARHQTPIAALAEANAEARRRPDPANFTDATQIYDYAPGAIYEVYGAPGFISTVLLEPGETIITVAAGDTTRWMVEQAVGGDLANARAMLLIKPTRANIRTNIVLVTDRRSYAIEAIATSGQTYSAQTAWRYPAAENDELAAPLPHWRR